MMNNWQQILREGAAALGLTLSPTEEDLFARYLALLLERNAQFNLTAISEPDDVALKHFVDSLTVETLWQPQPGDRVIDIGTGAGFPGIPMAIRYPGVTVVLNDSIRKKVDFSHEAISVLGLHNASAVWARAETLGRDKAYRGQYNAVFARAVAHLAALCEYALPLLKLHGVLIAMKGPSGAQEVVESQPVLELLGGRVTTVKEFSLGTAGERSLIVITKVAPTPQLFPREPGAARKKPLYLDSKPGTP